MTKEDLKKQVLQATQYMLDSSNLLVLTPAQQEAIRALNRAVLNGKIIDEWYIELPRDMKDELTPTQG